MQSVPGPILESFEAILEKRGILPPERASYKKWLRYFLDFCSKYPVPEARSDQVRLFINKLREKKQTPSQQDQAVHTVSLYFEIQRKGEIQGGDFHVSAEAGLGRDAKASSIQELQQLQTRSISSPEAGQLPDRCPGQAKTRLSISPPQRQP